MNSQKTLVFLHGWGATAKIFEPIIYLLKNLVYSAEENLEIIALDLPGFGNTPIEKVTTLKDYADFIYEFLRKNKIEEPIIIGHSFGGAVAAKLALFYPENISKLVLVSASAVRQPRRKIVLFKKIADILKPLLPEKFRRFTLKLLKYDKSDYAQIKSLELKETFKKVINEDLTPNLSQVKSPTLVIWGENDAITPLREGELIAKTIPGAKLAVIKNAGHFVFLEKPEEFTKLIKDFIK